MIATLHVCTQKDVRMLKFKIWADTLVADGRTSRRMLTQGPTSAPLLRSVPAQVHSSHPDSVDMPSSLVEQTSSVPAATTASATKKCNKPPSEQVHNGQA